MEVKICKWSKILKWIIGILILWYVVGLSHSLPEIFSSDEWSNEYITQEIYEEMNQYIDIEQSDVTLKDDVVHTYRIEKKSYYAKRLTEIACDLILFIFGFIITSKLSKKVVFDEMICKLVKSYGVILCIASFVIPSLGHVETAIGLFVGFGIDIYLDFYRLGCGFVCILLAYVLRHGQFLQEEYDTVL